MSPLKFFKTFSASRHRDGITFEKPTVTSQYLMTPGQWARHTPQHVPSPIPPRFFVEDHHDNAFSGPRALRNPETGSSHHSAESSPIPVVHRESSNAHFSDVHEASTPTGYQLALRNGSYATSSQSDEEGEQYPIPISATNSSLSFSDRIDNSTCSSESIRASPSLSDYSSWPDRHPYAAPRSRPLHRRYPHNYFQVAAPGQNEHGQIAADDRFSADSRDSDLDGDPPTYYIIPGGVNVIFQDEDGNEIMRVGDFSPRSRRTRRRAAPIIVQDEDGQVLYRSDNVSSKYYGASAIDTPFRDYQLPYVDNHGHDASRYHPRFGVDPPSGPFINGGHGESVSGDSDQTSRTDRSTASSQIILIDEYGRQIPIGSTYGSVPSQISHNPSLAS